MKRSEEAAGTEGRPAGVAAEFWHVLKTSKKWWLLPIVLVLALVGVLMVLSGSDTAPFVYTLF